MKTRPTKRAQMKGEVKGAEEIEEKLLGRGRKNNNAPASLLHVVQKR